VSDDSPSGSRSAAAVRTGVSAFGNGRFLVRGYDLVELARRVHFPDVAHLLIRGHLPSPDEQAAFCAALGDQAGLPDGVVDVLRRLPRGTSPIDAVRTGLSLLAGFEDPHTLSDTSPEATERMSIRILARTPTLAAVAHRALRGEPLLEPNPAMGFSGNLLWMALGRPPFPETVPMVDRVLTCVAEDGLGASTLAARVTASTMADPYAATVAAAAALKGPLHGGAIEAAARMFVMVRMAGGAAAAEAHVAERLEAGDRVPGFGGNAEGPDPRVALLEEDLDAFAGRDPDAAELVRAYRAVVATMAERAGLAPDADLPSGLLLHLVGLPVELLTPVVLCARTAGVAAHVLEQRAEQGPVRPVAVYEGPTGLTTPEGFAPSRC
jgi:citrate synthase